jgi:HAD superfamily hydrolase (TIGR01509 family)
MTRKKLVLFDCDGVLINSEDLIEESQQEAYAFFGLSLSLEFIRAQLTGLEYSDYMRRRAEVFTEYTGRALPEGYQEKLQAIFNEKAKTRLQAIDGIPELLKALSDAEIPLAVASNSGVKNLNDKLKLIGLQSIFFPHIYSRDHVPRGKPAPDVYLHAMTELGKQYRPDDCIVIDDSPPGVKAGVAAGMHVIGFARHGTAQAKGLMAAGASEVVGSGNELKQRLFQLLGLSGPAVTPAPQP